MNQKEFILEKKFIFPLIKGGNSRAYTISNPDLLIIFPYSNGSLIGSDQLIKESPNIYDYLLENREYLENRESGKFNGPNWYQFGRKQAIEIILNPKIFTPDLAPSPRFSYDEKGEFMFTGGAAGGYGIIPKKDVSPFFILGVLNSKVSEWFIKMTSTQMRGSWFSFESRYIKGVPFPSETQNSKLESLVIEAIESKVTIEMTKNKIDALVYELYGLTEEEIRIVEGG